MPWRLLPVALLAAAGETQAHAFSPDAGHFYNGLMHAFIDPAQVLLLLGLGLLAAQRDLRTARTVMVGVPLLALFSSALPVPASWLGLAENLVLIGAMLVAAAVVLARNVPAHWLPVLALIAAVGPGLVNGAELAREDWLIPRLYLSGAALGVFFLLMVCFVPFAKTRLALGEAADMPTRVLASWLLAGAALLLTLRLA